MVVAVVCRRQTLSHSQHVSISITLIVSGGCHWETATGKVKTVNERKKQLVGNQWAIEIGAALAQVVSTVLPVLLT